MTNNAERQIELMREQLENGDRGGSEADQKVLLEFSDELFLIPIQVGDQRHVKLLRHNIRMSEHTGSFVDALEDEDAAKEILRLIHRTYENPETNRDYRFASSKRRIPGKR